MDAITGYISAHPAALVIGVIFIIIFLLHFIFKSLIKLVLIMLLVLGIAFGYYYFQDPAKVPENVKETMEIIKSGANDMVEKSKTFFSDSKKLYKETKEGSGDVNKLLNESGKEVEKEFKK
ncbi:MAG: hypothetical protein CVU72_04835 [Deltaproteobacteria bacterium HGW-Deltaproteobacteria-7]|jgi:apolipoprotein N-acyltransferase|nr:MAG: hypothetical protein CVU72_04835 [Deltaproteobacteria bacterium HGW-Deltaproteobacteria-7]PKN50740.1 MAG: hypothetical protein CVU55_15560 [Deltaproteobacteria bacterium HGW-Deltaproteobacteria-13]